MNLNINWNKSDGLVPAIIQDSQTQDVLMLGYMNRDSLSLTEETGLVTFFSRTRQSVWQKGETSGNSLRVVSIRPDCDQDALLIQVEPQGPTCHRNTSTCFDGELEFLSELEQVIQSRFREKSADSYVRKLIESGLDRIVQKVGEEAVETVIAAKNENLDQLEDEASDLLFHLIVLLQYKKTSLSRISARLKTRHKIGTRTNS